MKTKGRDDLKAKDFLKQIEKLDTIIQNKLIEKAQWKSIALGITANYEGERVQSSGGQQKMSEAVIHCVDMEAEIDGLVDRLIDTKKEVISVIEQLNATEYDVLHRRYIQYQSYYEIAAAKKRDYNWVTTIHGRALKNVQRIIDDEDRNEKDT